MTEVKRELIQTKDGSHSLYQEDLNEHYHSIHGAMTESKHIFIEAGLKHLAPSKSNIRLFEVGFGTGLNATLTALYAKAHDLKVGYDTIELYPLKLELVQQLNYGEKDEAFKKVFMQLHQLMWNKTAEVFPNFSIHKIEGNLLSHTFQESYDLIYFDAFAPEKQNEMWTEQVFKTIYEAMNSGGILVTYCVKGEIRRRLLALGFECEKIPGPVGGKREMLRARKINS